MYNWKSSAGWRANFWAPWVCPLYSILPPPRRIVDRATCVSVYVGRERGEPHAIYTFLPPPRLVATHRPENQARPRKEVTHCITFMKSGDIHMWAFCADGKTYGFAWTLSIAHTKKWSAFRSCPFLPRNAGAGILELAFGEASVSCTSLSNSTPSFFRTLLIKRLPYCKFRLLLFFAQPQIYFNSRDRTGI